MWKTRITELLGIKYPIILGAMAYISESQLVASICHEGGTGVIASGGFSVDEVQRYIHEVRDMCGKQAVFGVNLMLQSPNKDDIAQLVCDEKVPFVTIGAGNASSYINPLHQAGIHALAIVPTVKLAERVQERGADAVIIEGMEAGGHDGKLTLMALMENVIPSLEIPVISAGGISDGRGIAAALIMGSSGVQIGTRFLLAEECQTHINYKNALIHANDKDSVVTGFSKNDSVRGLRNAFTKKYLEAEYDGASIEELRALSHGTTKKAVIEGDVQNGYVLAGMSLTNLKKIQPMKEIMSELIAETEYTLEKASSLLK
ncbi:nitronate monooxygenase [Dialister pneumosintes]|jgi:Dioxygenases related to 2-nitropropane dioxygenase|uniref:Probable nitronate monooxygenase n=1 Tax=Dialister pneumosintes TaxID=39950 RepID=A0A1B3WDK1_9FIRM|nr:nitronate monooxygenase [Dialister pneumosintes]AOH39003.1 2-nitropropane dioxygenase [Dialister pneumosintes]RID94030.1 enoyl-[acyl-carrier-protein] reductase FabK [Dialister pneumosintes]CDF27340.1 enoyl-(Acyl-carrier-protein) reductase II [Dialister sp. CAG:588]